MDKIHSGGEGNEPIMVVEKNKSTVTPPIIVKLKRIVVVEKNNSTSPYIVSSQKSSLLHRIHPLHDIG